MKVSKDNLRQDVETYLKKGGKINQVREGQSGRNFKKYKNVKATDRDIRNMAVIALTRKSFSGDRIRCAKNKNRIIR